jgi:hypothetical protein
VRKMIGREKLPPAEDVKKLKRYLDAEIIQHRLVCQVLGVQKAMKILVHPTISYLV